MGLVVYFGAVRHKSGGRLLCGVFGVSVGEGGVCRQVQATAFLIRGFKRFTFARRRRYSFWFFTPRFPGNLFSDEHEVLGRQA